MDQLMVRHLAEMMPDSSARKKHGLSKATTRFLEQKQMLTYLVSITCVMSWQDGLDYASSYFDRGLSNCSGIVTCNQVNVVPLLLSRYTSTPTRSGCGCCKQQSMQQPSVGDGLELNSVLKMQGYFSSEASRAIPCPINVKLAGCCADGFKLTEGFKDQTEI